MSACMVHIVHVWNAFLTLIPPDDVAYPRPRPSPVGRATALVRTARLSARGANMVFSVSRPSSSGMESAVPDYEDSQWGKQASVRTARRKAFKLFDLFRWSGRKVGTIVADRKVAIFRLARILFRRNQNSSHASTIVVYIYALTTR